MAKSVDQVNRQPWSKTWNNAVYLTKPCDLGGGEFAAPIIRAAVDTSKITGATIIRAASTISAGGRRHCCALSYGETEDFAGTLSMTRCRRKHDLQATILHLMGIDHEYKMIFAPGRRFRLIRIAQWKGILALRLSLWKRQAYLFVRLLLAGAINAIPIKWESCILSGRDLALSKGANINI